MSDYTYLNPAETAKLVRQRLKSAFPGRKFSVRSERYAGGGSINVRWEDGPLESAVEAVVRQYEGGGFDGSIDLAYYRTHYLKPDGTVLVHFDPGTEGSMGHHQGEDNRMLIDLMPEEVKLVKFGADFVFCHRSRSNHEERLADALQWIYEHCVIDNATGDPRRDRFGVHWVDHLANHLIHQQREDETIAQVFWRIV